jgi:glutaminyl-peptide cyclotransferase
LTITDGSRHLANQWLKQGKLSRIRLLMLLDLIGTQDVQFQNFDLHAQTGTYDEYQSIARIETALRRQGKL